MKTYYYGGKFNPFTKGHLSVLKNLFEHVKKNWVSSGDGGSRIVIGIKRGSMDGSVPDMKRDDKDMSYVVRQKLVQAGVMELVEENRDIVGNGLYIYYVEQNEDRTWAYLNSGPDWLPSDWKVKKDVTIVMGEDERLDFEASVIGKSDKWRFAKEISEVCEVIGFTRDHVVSSTRVREIFRANPFVNYSDVSDYLQKPVYDYIVDQMLYWQCGREEWERQQENQFLGDYDMSKFPRPSCTATVLANFRGEVLLVRRKGRPFRGFWALPGGFFDVVHDYSLEHTAARELEEETGLVFGTERFRQFHTFSEKGLDPRGRIVDTVFTVDLTEDDDEDPELDPKAGDDAAEVRFWPVDKLPRMAFHHREVIEDWCEREKRIQEMAKEKQ